jgi:FCP1-like phosphatase family protein
LVMSDNGRTHRYFVKLRPKLQYFLDELSPLFQMSIYTHGTRKYAEGTCKIMDPEGVYFGRRIVSRSDHPELGANKSLAHLLKTDWSMVLIYDDREDVWKGEQGDHLLCAKPFVHFDQQAKGVVVNNAPGLLSLGTKQSADAIADSSDENLPCELEEDDEGLVQAVSTFKKLHQLYFDSTTSGAKISIGSVLHDFRLKILAGCVICFSGVIPITDRNPEKHVLWRTASKLGAKVESTVSEQTTHLLAVGLGGRKTRECLERKDVFVTHCDWLLHCHWNVQHEDESAYSLVPEHCPSLAKAKVLDRAVALGDLIANFVNLQHIYAITPQCRVCVCPCVCVCLEKRPLAPPLLERAGEEEVLPTLKKARCAKEEQGSAQAQERSSLRPSQDESTSDDSSGSSSDDDDWLQELENDVAFADDKN